MFASLQTKSRFFVIWCIAAVAMSLIVSQSWGGINFSPHNDVVESPVMSGQYILTVPTNHVGNYPLVISGDGLLADSLQKLTIIDPRDPGYGSSDGINTGTPDITVTLNNLHTVSSIVLESDEGESFVRVVIGNGNVRNIGELRISEFHGPGQILDDVTGPIVLTNYYTPPPGANSRTQMLNVFVGGNFEADLLIRGDPDGVWPGGYAILGLTVVGNIGSPTSPVHWQVDGFLSMRAGGFHGDLHYPDDTTRGPSVQRFRMDQANGSGDIADGTLVFGKLQRTSGAPGSIYASGDIDADIHVSINLDNQDFPDCTSCSCRCCYEDWGVIEAAGDIRGQIVIGSNPDPLPQQYPATPGCPAIDFNLPLWEGLVAGGSVTIDPTGPDGHSYQYKAALLGGGSVGFPPFRLHEQELSVEPGYMSLRLIPTVVNPLRIVHYGPVEWDALDGEPLFIETRVCDDEAGWVAVAPTEYSVSYTLDGPLRMIELAFDDPLISENEYRIRPVTPALMPTLASGYAYLWSTQDSSQDISVQEWEVVYRVGTCLSDLNNDGEVDAADQGILLNQFGMTAGSGFLLSDVNGDGVVDAADLGILLNEFGGGCEGCPGDEEEFMMLGGGSEFETEMLSGGCGGSLHAAVQFLGFDDPCEYSVFVQSLSGNAITAHALLLIDALQIIGNN